MAFDLDAPTNDSSRLGNSGRLDPGMYHFALRDFKEHQDKHHIFVMEVLAAEKANAEFVGTIYEEKVWASGGTNTEDTSWIDRLYKMAFAFGILLEKDYGIAKERGLPVPLEFRDAIDRQCFATIELYKEKYRQIADFGFAIFNTGDEAARKRFPVNREVLGGNTMPAPAPLPAPSPFGDVPF